MNTLPSPKDLTFAFYRRKEVPGILAWALRGFLRLKRNNFQFTYSQAADNLMEEYKREISPVLYFISECIIEDQQPPRSKQNEFYRRVYYEVLYSEYRNWCSQNGINDSLTRKQFIRKFQNDLAQNGIKYEKHHSGNSRYFTGIQILGLHIRSRSSRESRNFADE